MRLVSALLATAALAVAIPAPAAFANTNAGGVLYVCATPQQADLSQAGFEALTWVKVSNLGNHGETGSNTNILTYDTWDTAVVQKSKGLTDAGSPEIEVARAPTDAGQIIMRAACQVNLNYAFKLVKNDPVSATGTGTIIYNRGLVTGPRRPNGRNEDFDLEMYTLGLNQVEIVVNPTGTGNAPINTAVPTITGTPKVNNILTATTGTFTGDPTITYQYAWFAGGSLAAGTQGNATYLPVAADIGKVMTVRVTATNGAGSANSTSAPTAVVAA